MVEVDSQLVKLCIEAATEDSAAVERWRLQRRSLERLPSPIASALLHRLLNRRLLYPSLLEVFKFSIEEVDLRGQKTVDAEWMAYLGAFPYLYSLNISDCYRINSHALWPLAGSTALKELDISRCRSITDGGIQHLYSISSLEKLYISQTGVTGSGVKRLKALNNLSTLDLGGLPVSDLIMNHLQVLTNLEYLDLWGTKISDEGAATFKNFPKLSFLNLTWTNVTKLPNLKSLKSLNMTDCSIHSVMENGNAGGSLQKLIVQGASFTHFKKTFSDIETSSLTLLNLSKTSFNDYDFLLNMHALEHLDLSSSNVQDNNVDTIASIGSSLKYLNLSGTKISTVGVEILAGHVPDLEVLLLSNTCIDDFAISYVGLMPSLKEISLSNNHMNIKGFARLTNNNEDEILLLEALQNLKHLESLDLEENVVTDEALSVICGFEKLSHLSLGGCTITDHCLDHLSSAKKLVNLSIWCTLVSNGGLDSFDPPATLEVLDLRGCWLLTMDALSSFCETNPHIKVWHDELATHEKDTGNSRSHVGSKQSGVKSKRKEGRSQMSHLFRRDILEQRLKYSKEELLDLQHLPSSLVPPFDMCTEVLKME